VKRDGILNAQLAGALARLGHTDMVVVADVGLPIPGGPEVADLAFRLGVPEFEVVLSGLLDELVIERAVAAEEVRRHNPACHQLLVACFQTLEFVPHEALKAMVRDARLVVRTGEASPYANVLLRCGVPF
jgi:D-ribose pyranase